jgi:hypothetical protein
LNTLTVQLRPDMVAASLTGAKVNDVTQLLPQIDTILPIHGLRGHPLRKPRMVYADLCGASVVTVASITFWWELLWPLPFTLVKQCQRHAWRVRLPT